MIDKKQKSRADISIEKLDKLCMEHGFPKARK